MIVRWLINAAVLLGIAYLLDGIRLDGVMAALVAAAILGAVNALIRPILLILTLPLTVLTLGLFTFVINALMLMLTASVVNGFEVAGFWAALLGSLLLSVASTLVSALIR